MFDVNLRMHNAKDVRDQLTTGTHFVLQSNPLNMASRGLLCDNQGLRQCHLEDK